jgi:allantoicase
MTPEPSFRDLVDLANERVGGAAIACSDDYFAGMENLVKAKPAVWREDEYTDRGKWMDGWESRRKREPDGVDWCIVRLGVPGVVKGIVVDTAFFKGNFPAACALDVLSVDGYPTADELAVSTDWLEVLPEQRLEGHSENAFAIDGKGRATHVRLRIFPDGGVARLRVFGEAVPDWKQHGGLSETLDLASVEMGGIVESCSDMFFGSRHNMIHPGNGTGMHDGWETKRSRREGHDWAVIRLAARGSISRVVVDTHAFKGNYPESVALDATDRVEGERTKWFPIFPRTQLLPDTKHIFTEGLVQHAELTHVRVKIFPDGGVSRVRLFGRISERGRSEQRARALDTLLPKDAMRAFLSCCGSRRYAAAMVAARPFHDEAKLFASSEHAFDGLTRDDWLEAFAAHPRIGGTRPGTPSTRQSARWSSEEQARVGEASDDVRAKLEKKNETYLARFNFVFIVCASGKTPEEILAILEKRLGNDEATELQNAGLEQRKITRLRLAKIV